VIDNVHSTMTRSSRLPLSHVVKMLRRPFIFWLYSCKIWLLTLIESLKKYRELVDKPIEDGKPVL